MWAKTVRIALMGIAVLVGTSTCTGSGETRNTVTEIRPQPGFDGAPVVRLTDLTAPCVIDSVTGNLTLTVGAGETAYLYYNQSSGTVAANASVGGLDCAVSPSKRITIRSHDLSAQDDQKVLIDFSFGTFALATKAAASGDATSGPNIIIDLGAGSGDQVKVFGTNTADTITLGSDLSASPHAALINVQAAPAAKRNFPDIRITGTEEIIVTAGPADDVITAQAGSAVGSGISPLEGAIRLTVYGGAGNDTIISGAASTNGAFNTLYGGAGDDRFIQQAAKATDDIHGDDGIDLVDYSSRTAPVTVTIGAGSGDDGEAGEGDTIGADIENIIGGSGDDTIDATGMDVASHLLIGGAGNDLLIGAAMADHLYGGEGNDTLKGGGGDDILEGGDGDDVIQGGLGNDTIEGGGANCPTTTPAMCVAATPAKIGSNLADYSDRSARVFVDLSNPTAVPTGETGESDVLLNIISIRGGSGDDVLTGDERGNAIWGGPGNDVIHGGDGDDALYGDGGDDQLYGEGGNDFLSGGPGSDTLVGGDGNDLLDADDGERDAVIDCGPGDADVALTDSSDMTPTGCEM